MPKFLSSLYTKLSAGYLLLLVLFCAASIYVTMHTAERFVEESAQRLNKDLAAGLASQIEPYIGDSLDVESIRHTMHVLMVFNPWVEIYLLDEHGSILTYMADPGAVRRTSIPLEPIERFLAGHESFPIRDADPKSSSDDKIFSATRVPLPSTSGVARTGYLYVVLHGKGYASAAAMVRDNYIVSGALDNIVLLFAFTALAGLLLFALLTRRFRDLTRTVTAFAGGELDQRVEIRSGDEIGRLGTAFNEMADRLQQNLEDLRQRDDLRREFVANITHDLRSPLTSMRGYVETAMMKNETLTPQERMEYLQIILEDTTLLDALVRQLLELAELEAPEIRVAREPFPPCELVQDVVMKFRPKAEELGVALRSTLANDLPSVSADIGMIERVISNLIDNALRYTPRGGSVEVDGARVDGHVQLRVHDTGYGIAADDLPHITERFYKVRGRKARTSGGTGLGLAIVKRVLELHDSALEVQSAEGAGTTMEFSLPTSDGA